MWWVGVNGAVYCVVQKQKALVTVLSVGIFYVPNCLYEIGHPMYSTAAEASYGVQNIYTGCPRRNVKYFGRVFLESNYTDITQKTCIQS